ncbi:3'-5' exonuclease [Pseudomonas mucidolens]|uniref:DNA polymerase-3 subunit epsilon n=1 Tax=Pseudomonas mucidolens TaxID=46679 RepID=A0A1H2LZB1_9PSED|nr:3'-5' exonuclease [Pseudomonas mucidolens]SDU85626.1 DNA polymerase-3 subunit epsilon [Pseudomonas mucidolens]SQH35058.1 DNA polymerase III subunit epsilon [Pseudomonas mucidolens]
MRALKSNPNPQLPDWSAQFEVLAKKARHPGLRQYYQAGVVPAQTSIDEVQFLAMDVETTGLNPQAHSIVSIGLIPFTLQRIHCSQAQYWVLKPTSELSEKSVTFHHITHTEILNAPTFEAVLDPLLEAMAGKVMVVHYRNLERAFLGQAVLRLLKEELAFPVIDTMQLEARIHRQKRGWFARLMRRSQASIRLADSRERYNLPAYHAHHALTDALATAELLQAQIATLHSPSTPVGALWN